MASNTSIILIVLAVLFGGLFLNSFFGNPANSFIQGIFNGSNDNTTPPGQQNGQQPPLKVTVDTSLENGVSKDIFNLNSTNKIFVRVTSNQRVQDVDLVVLEPYTNKELLKINSQKISLNATTQRYEWTVNKSVFNGNKSYVVAAVKQEGNTTKTLGEKQISLISNDELSRQKLSQKYPWPDQNVIGFTPNHATGTIEFYAVNPNLNSNDTLDDTLEYPIIPKEKILISVNGENKKPDYLTVTMFDPDETEGEFEGDPFKTRLDFDYTEYFNTKKDFPTTMNYKIVLPQQSFTPESPPIHVTVNLNESGAILFKEGNQELKTFLKDLAYKKGWELIPVDLSVQAKGEKKQGKLFLQEELVVTVNDDYSVRAPKTPATPKTTTEELVKNAITSAYNKKPFEHLLIIGSGDNSIPFFNTKQNFLEQNQPFDLEYYGNVNEDPFIELSVGRIPTTSTPNLSAYFEDTPSPVLPIQQDYVYVAGKNKINSQQDEVEYAQAEEKNNAFIRKQFIYTGFVPEFSQPQLPAPEEKVFSVKESPQGETVIDDFSTDCEKNSGELIFLNQSRCDFDFELDYSLFSDKVFLAKTRSKNTTTEQKLTELKELVPNELFSVLHQPWISGKQNPTIGIALRDYVNGAIVSNGKPVYHVLIGDPSNTVQVHKPLSDAAKQAQVIINNNDIELVMPKLNLNDFYYLGPDKPFTSDETEMIKQGHFAEAQVAASKTNYPFITETAKAEPIEPAQVVFYQLVLDRDLKSDEDNDTVLLQTFNKIIEAQGNPVPAEETKAFKYRDYSTRVALQAVTNLIQNHKSMELRQAWPEYGKNIVVDKGEEKIGENTYNYETLRIGDKGDNSRYPNYLNSAGTIELTPKTDGGLTATVELEIEGTATDEDSDNPLLLYFDSYDFVLVGDNGINSVKNIDQDFTVDVTNKKNLTLNFESTEELKGYDTIQIYGNSEKFQDFPFIQYPILSAKIRKADGTIITNKKIGFENTYNFLTYSDSTILLKILHRDLGDSSSEVLSQVLEANNVFPLVKKSTNIQKVFLVETKNSSHPALTPDVKQTVAEIFKQQPELKEKFSNQNQVLIVDASLLKKFEIVFVPNRYFFSNGFSLVPQTYGDLLGVKTDYESVNDTLESTVDESLKATTKIGNTEKEINFNIKKIETDTKTGFSFELGLKNMFELISQGAADVFRYTITIGGFEKSFEASPEREPGINTDKTVNIVGLSFGGTNISPNSDIEMTTFNGNEFISTIFSTNINEFKQATLFANNEKIAILENQSNASPGTQSFGMSSYSTGKTLSGIIGEDTDIEFFVRVIGKDENPTDSDKIKISVLN